MTFARRLATAIRQRTVGRGIAHRLRQLAYANTHSSGHYLKLGLALPRRVAEQPMSFSIDVVSTCNLLCPTCPVANWPKESWTGVKGIMDAALLHRLIQKAIGECLVADVKLYAYTEPLLHPRLPELIAVVTSYKLPCHISTNLNVLRDADALMRAEPDEIMVSVSGFTQDIYAIGHAGGDIETVKQHMRLLADAKQRVGAKTDLVLMFHKYRHNVHELPLMKTFAASLGMRFEECWATFFPLEKVLTFAKPELAMATVTDVDQRIIDRLGISLKDAVAEGSRAPVDSCELQDHAVILDVTGSVYLCCESAMDATQNRIASFLDTPLSIVQQRKKQHRLCTACMAGGLPLMAERLAAG